MLALSAPLGGCGTRTEEPAREAPAATSSTPGALEEVSQPIDPADVKPFLGRVARHIDSGFGEPEIARVEELIQGLDAGEDGQIEFTVLHQGATGPMTIVVKLDEEAPDLHFFAAPPLATAIRGEMELYGGSRGR